MPAPVVDRIAGAAALVGIVAVVALGFGYRFARPAGTTDIRLHVAEAGVGMQPGTDVKVRGVTVGKVVAVELGPDALPVVTARLNAGVQVPADDLTVTITPKTFFGEKQIELAYPLAAFGRPPFLRDGAVIDAGGNPTEVEDVLQALTPLLDRIDEQDLATLFDATAALKGQGDRIGQGIEATAELAQFGNSITDQTLRTVRRLSRVADGLEPGASAFDRLNAALPGAVAVLAQRQGEIDATLRSLSSLSLTAASFVDVEKVRLDRLLATNEIVGAFLERNIESIPSIIDGLEVFAETQSRPSPFLDDNGAYIPFRVFIDLGDSLGNLLGPLLGPVTELGGTGGS